MIRKPIMAITIVSWVQCVRRLRSFLTLWLMLVSTGVTFAHSHAGGATRHGHGVGVTFRSAPCHAPDCLHSHFVLLGVELDAPPPADNVACSAHTLIDSATMDALTIDFDFVASAPIIRPDTLTRIDRRSAIPAMPGSSAPHRHAVLRL